LCRKASGFKSPLPHFGKKSIATGEEIIIEQCEPEEVTCIGGKRVAPEGVEVLNPSFDGTPANYITAIIMEEEVWRPKGD
jgi:methylthioribose-1-phosphate isomerase